MLHTVNKSPHSNSSFELCTQFAAKNEPVLLYEDAVYGAQSGTKFEARMKELLNSNPVYALKADIDARGLKNLISGIQIINYEGFVDLVAQHKVQNWL